VNCSQTIADVVESLDLVKDIRVSEATLAKIKQNLVWVLGYNAGSLYSYPHLIVVCPITIRNCCLGIPCIKCTGFEDGQRVFFRFLRLPSGSAIKMIL